jgi:hypothetical protein
MRSGKQQYNGWCNWDTWNTALWLGNDECSYREVIAICASNRSRKFVAESLVSLYLRTIPESEDINFLAIDWNEIIDSFQPTT